MADTGAQQEVREVLDELLAAQNAGNGRQLRSLLSDRHDGVHIGTDADEWETSQEFADIVAAGDDDGIQAVADNFDIHVLGDVAWVEGRARFINPSGGERPIRVTAVLVRENGQWRGVQSHASIGVPEADIFG